MYVNRVQRPLFISKMFILVKEIFELYATVKSNFIFNLTLGNSFDALNIY